MARIVLSWFHRVMVGVLCLGGLSGEVQAASSRPRSHLLATYPKLENDLKSLAHQLFGVLMEAFGTADQEICRQKLLNNWSPHLSMDETQRYLTQLSGVNALSPQERADLIKTLSENGVRILSQLQLYQPRHGSLSKDNRLIPKIVYWQPLTMVTAQPLTATPELWKGKMSFTLCERGTGRVKKEDSFSLDISIFFVVLPGQAGLSYKIYDAHVMGKSVLRETHERLAKLHKQFIATGAPMNQFSAYVKKESSNYNEIIRSYDVRSKKRG